MHSNQSTTTNLTAIWKSSRRKTLTMLRTHPVPLPVLARESPRTRALTPRGHSLINLASRTNRCRNTTKFSYRASPIERGSISNQTPRKHYTHCGIMFSLTACVFYLYTGKINFLPLKSAGSSKRQLALLSSSDKAPACSPKSMYRLAELVGVCFNSHCLPNTFSVKL